MSAIDRLPFVDAIAFEALRDKGTPFVAAFLATWNRRCQGFAPAYEEFARRCGARLPVVCVDVDESVKLTGSLDVCSVPTVLVLAGREEIHREVGLELAPVTAVLEVRGYAAGL